MRLPKLGLSKLCIMYLLGLLAFLEIVSAKDQADHPSLLPVQCSSSTFTAPQVGRGVTVLSVHAEPQHNFTSITGGPLLPSINGLDFCQVKIHLTHQLPHDGFGNEKTKDNVLVEVWLPLTRDDWNGRLQATGGAGFATGMFGAHLGVAVQHGWAAVSTDGGHDADLRKLSDASWILPSSKERRFPLNSGPQRDIAWDLLHNFASRSLVDQIVVAKSIVRQFYGVDAHHSYWNGCSTGGRQGYRVAQKYPELLDGILANAPAISFVNLVMGELWPQQVMKKAKFFLSKCQLDYFRAKAIEHCELEQRVKTGYVQDSENCSWDPSQLIGSTFWCDGSEVTVTQTMAEIVQAIQNGPGGSSVENRFPGLRAGVSMTALANNQIDKDGRRTSNPFRIAASWLQKVVLQDEATSETTFDENYINSLWVSALYEFGGLLNTDDPDLSRLRESGAKLLTWHGTDDQLIPFQNTVKYRRTVEAIMGGANEVDEYYRLFLAPGVDHCGGGVGPIPTDPLDALVRWVEDNEPPEILDAEMIDQEGDVVTRELCLWPATSKYMNIGDPKRASSWSCVGGTERPQRAEQEFETEFDYGSMQQPQQNIADDQTDSSKDRPGRAGQILAGLGNRLQGLDLGLRVE